jgi:hypothetical protein
MAHDARDAANSLISDGQCRSCISRCYYSAYAAVTSELLRAHPHMSFRYGRRNPDHGSLPQYVMGRLTHLPEPNRRAVARHLRLLRLVREDADYRPDASVDQSVARSARRAAYAVFRELGVL